MDLSVGALVRGKYRVERVLGEGGMGVVVAAWDPDLERRVAIKVLRSAVVAHAETVQRFLREARAAAKLQSDHVAHVIEVGSEDGAPFMVMEYLEGHDLSAVVQRGERPPFGVAASWVIDACHALREAHALGIVHRDLKPANLFLASRRDGPPRVKVLDFGISKVADPQDLARPGVTRPSVVMGTPEYMSPEQMVSTRDVDARADIFALGVILYELCTGALPFTGETTTQRYLNISMKRPPAPRSIQPSIPPGLEAVILACLAAERDQRIGDVSELTERLRPFAATAAEAGTAPAPGTGRGGGDAHTPGRAGPVAAVSQRASGTLAVASDRVAPPRKSSRWPVAVAAVGLMGAAAIAVVVARHGGAARADPQVAASDAATTAPAAAPSAMALAPTADATPAPKGSASAITMGGPERAPQPPPSAAASASANRAPAGPHAPPRPPAAASARKAKDSYD